MHFRSCFITHQQHSRAYLKRTQRQKIRFKTFNVVLYMYKKVHLDPRRSKFNLFTRENVEVQTKTVTSIESFKYFGVGKCV